MDERVVSKYRELRQDHVARFAGNGRVYHHKTPASYALNNARYIVETEVIWEEAGDNVRLSIVPDYDWDYGNLAGDCYNPEANPNINPARLARMEQEFIEKINQEGVWGIVGEFICPCCGEWRQADDVWGFVGDDWKGSGYDVDVMHETATRFMVVR